MSATVRSSPIAHRNVHEAVVDGIRDMILNAQLKPGDWLRQDELAEAFGVSTMPVREALRQLQAEGLVVLHRRRGAAVATLSASDGEEIYRIREALESLAVRWAAENIELIPIERIGKNRYSDVGAPHPAHQKYLNEILIGMLNDYLPGVRWFRDKDSSLRFSPAYALYMGEVIAYVMPMREP